MLGMKPTHKGEKKMTPSVKRIMNVLGDNLRKDYGNDAVNKAKLIRAYMEMGEISRDVRHPVDDALDNINRILNGYGVEAIRDNQWAPYYMDIGLLYVNMGDTYTGTVIFDTRSKRFIVSDWGTIVERNEKRFA